MTRAAWIDAAIGAALVGMTAAVSVISAHVAPGGYQRALYVLTAAIGVLATFQAARAVLGTLDHERTFAELREGQEYLAQPESYRQFNLIWQRQEALTAAEDVFQKNFEIDDREPAATRVRCTHCDWHVEKALVYTREEAVQHFRASHVPPERAGSWWRRRFEFDRADRGRS